MIPYVIIGLVAIIAIVVVFYGIERGRRKKAEAKNEALETRVKYLVEEKNLAVDINNDISSRVEASEKKKEENKKKVKEIDNSDYEKLSEIMEKEFGRDNK